LDRGFGPRGSAASRLPVSVGSSDVVENGFHSVSKGGAFPNNRELLLGHLEILVSFNKSPGALELFQLGYPTFVIGITTRNPD
jgi:hypothetical protein